MEHKAIPNTTKLPTTTVKPNQLSFRWIKLESIRELGFGEVGFGKVGFGEVGFGEVGFGEVGFGEVGFQFSKRTEDIPV